MRIRRQMTTIGAVTFVWKTAGSAARCGSYLVDEYEHDTESEDEIGADMDETEWAAFTGFTGEETYDTLLNAYLLARRRFRAFTGRFPRSRRFPRRASWGMHI